MNLAIKKTEMTLFFLVAVHIWFQFFVSIVAAIKRETRGD